MTETPRDELRELQADSTPSVSGHSTYLLGPGGEVTVYRTGLPPDVEHRWLRWRRRCTCGWTQRRGLAAFRNTGWGPLDPTLNFRYHLEDMAEWEERTGRRWKVQGFITAAYGGGERRPYTPTYWRTEEEARDQATRLYRDHGPGMVEVEIVPPEETS